MLFGDLDKAVVEYFVQKHLETKSRLQAVSLKGECQSTFLIPLCLPLCPRQILRGVQDKYFRVSKTNTSGCPGHPVSSNQDYSGIRCWPVILKTSVNSYICVCIDLTKHIPPTLYRPHMPLICNIGKSTHIARVHWSVGHVHTHRLKAHNRSGADSAYYWYNAKQCNTMRCTTRLSIATWIMNIMNAVQCLKAHIHIHIHHKIAAGWQTQVIASCTIAQFVTYCSM